MTLMKIDIGGTIIEGHIHKVEGGDIGYVEIQEVVEKLRKELEGKVIEHQTMGDVQIHGVNTFRNEATYEKHRRFIDSMLAEAEEAN